MDKAEDVSRKDSLLDSSEGLIQTGKGGTRYIRVLQQNPDTWNIQRLQVKRVRHSSSWIYCFCRKDARVCTHWNRSFHMHLTHLKPVSCIFTSWAALGLTAGSGCSLMATRWKRPWCWERLRAGRERSDREWDGWMASWTQHEQHRLMTEQR